MLPRVKLPARTNFPEVIRSLQAQGVNQRTIARSLRVAPSTVHRWLLDEAEPGHTHGVRLLYLAERQRSAQQQAQSAATPRTRSILTLLGNRPGEK